MKVPFVSLFLLVCVFAAVEVNGYKILGLLHIPVKSHYIVISALMRELAHRGHEVTVITAFKEPNPIPNYEEIYIENSLPDAMKSKTITFSTSLQFLKKKLLFLQTYVQIIA